jgi:predicted O-methyltransferase YrrM
MLRKPIEAVRITTQALRALYFDAFHADPKLVAGQTRNAIREATFHISGLHELNIVDLAPWLSSFAAVPQTVVIPVAAAPGTANEGVGDTTYFLALGSICAAINPARIVEFGTFLGIGTTTMALNCQAEILTIDLPDSSQADDIRSLNEADQSLVTRSRNRIGSFYADKPVRQRIRELRCDSRQLDLTQHVRQAQLCLVDGGHSYECVAADTANALRVLAPGGIIVWDDYYWRYPDVARYLNELARSGKSLARIRGTNLVVYKS